MTTNKKRTTIYISHETQQKLDQFKEDHPEINLNISTVCERAILQALHKYRN
jgi:type II secretory pathway component HofQ